MDMAYLHLLLNHIPIEITGLGAVGLIAALVTKNRTVWLFALATLTLGGLGSGIAWLSGHGAEDPIRDMWWVQPGTIHEHEDAANWATGILLLLAVVSGMAWRQLARSAAETLPRWMRIAIIVLALFGMTAVTRTAYLGGKIEHDAPYLKPGSSPPPGSVLPAKDTTRE